MSGTYNVCPKVQCMLVTLNVDVIDWPSACQHGPCISTRDRMCTEKDAADDRGFRERMLADPTFLVKVGIEVRPSHLPDNTCTDRRTRTLYPASIHKPQEFPVLCRWALASSQRALPSMQSAAKTSARCACPSSLLLYLAGFARRSAAWLSDLVNTCSSPDLYAVQELDFVLANVIMALVADFMLVWLPAPTLSFK